MTISAEDVEHVARLARLGLTDEEKQQLTEQLDAILEYAQRVSEVDTSDVEPMAHAIEQKNVFRSDGPSECLTQEQALAAAPEAEAGGFVVPRIV